DDLAGPALEHLLADLAAQNELRVQIHLEDAVPVFVGMLRRGLAQDGPSIIDQDVDHRNIPLHLLDERVQRLAVAEIAGVAAELAAARDHLAFERATLAFKLRADSDNIGAGFGQRQGHRFADAAAGARHQGGLAVQFELIEYVHDYSS